ncbi:MAG: ADP-ribose pyrophosphatase [Candidatus Methanophagaceae archaeon]|nr:MAG: ADP-ribose pyrophosphatase [Methanophagales archaeon]
MKEEKTIESRQIYGGRRLTLRVDTVSLPNGETRRREIVSHPGAAAVVALVGGEGEDEGEGKDEGEDKSEGREEAKVLLVEQYRKAVESSTLEIPAGTLEEGESAQECAERELVEETGFRAGKMERLVEFYPSPGFSSELISIFKATGLKQVSGVEAELSVKFEGVKELLAKVRRGELKDGKTIVGVLSVLCE